MRLRQKEAISGNLDTVELAELISRTGVIIVPVVISVFSKWTIM
jgi:hypothetical protein